MKRILLQLVLALQAACVAQAGPWVSAYYGGWWQGGQLNPKEIDYSAVTHIIHFALVLQPDGTFSGDANGLTPASIMEAVYTTHAAGKKIILCVGGSNSNAAFAGATRPGVRQKFINELVAFMTKYTYDGIDIDWEPISTKTYYLDFVRELREAMTAAKPGSELITAVMMYDDANLIARAERYLDQINLMTYDMSGPWQRWVTWHNSPLYTGGYTFPSTGGAVPCADDAVKDKVHAGIPPSKLGIGIEFYGYRWWGGDGTPTGGVTAPRQEWKKYPNVKSTVPYFQIMDTYSRYPVHWDEAAEAAWIGIDRVGSADDEFISFDNEQTIQSKANYIKAKGLGGVIVFDLGGGYRRNVPLPYRDILLQTVKSAFFGAPKQKTDTEPPVVAFQAPAPNANLSGDVTVSVRASDNVGMSAVEVTLDHAETVGESAKAPFELRMNTWRYPAGPHTLYATAYDLFGNSRTATVPITISNAGARPALPDIWVFDEALRTPFTNTSWGATVEFGYANAPQAGSLTAKVSYNGWGAFDILSGTWGAEVRIDPADYDTLRFEALPLSELPIKIAFYNSYSYEVRLKPNQWNVVAVPLNFREPFSRFYIQSDRRDAVTCYFDNIRFTGTTKKVISSR